MPTAARSDEVFLRDLVAAFRAWRGAWWLPVISVLLGSSVWASGAERLLGGPGEEVEVGSADPGLALLLLVVSTVELGWFGTEREVYRRVWAGDGEPGADLLRLTLRYIGRFLRLGLLIGWPVALGLVVAPESLAAGSAVVLVATMAAYVVATFATCELAYRTTSAAEAARQGIATVREHWSTVRWHVLIPPVFVVTFGAAVGASELPLAARALLGALTTLSALAMKGAIAHRWLLLHGVAGILAVPGSPHGQPSG